MASHPGTRQRATPAGATPCSANKASLVDALNEQGKFASTSDLQECKAKMLPLAHKAAASGRSQHRLGRVAETDGHPVVDVHQTDRDRQIDQLLFLEHRARG